jgi:hypothetical protein
LVLAPQLGTFPLDQPTTAGEKGSLRVDENQNAGSEIRLEVKWFPVSSVMPALVAGIHVFLAGFRLTKGVDGRDKPSHHSEWMVRYEQNAL